MTNEDILSQFPDGDLKNIMQELIVANDSLANKEPVYGFTISFMYRVGLDLYKNVSWSLKCKSLTNKFSMQVKGISTL